MPEMQVSVLEQETPRIRTMTQDRTEKERTRKREWVRKWRKDNPEAYEKHKAKQCANIKEWRINNPKEARIRDKEQREKHKERRRIYASRYTRKYYSTHKEEYRIMNASKRAEMLLWWSELNIPRACTVCGEKDADCLDFHHRNPKEKEHSPAGMLSGLFARRTILREIAKCDVLCANCHRKEHARIKKATLAVAVKNLVREA